ncbi:hypothetical protein Patl1_19459 [Pistacia atlantica]|uniref:Uncharacterized protein n=1 Tax=Pistacia atlantica TaxID=434234 RepID=A0ACC1C3B5_9ROSI|nr:hypothetical protein Patl1_19459 [Pistacia atlantica]
MTLHSIIIQKLLSTNAHLGRRVAAHHFKQFTYGNRNGMAIIDSDKTLICLRSACHFISLLAQRQASFMFVNTNPLFDEIIVQMTKKIGCYNPNMNALCRMGGFLTNSLSPKKFRSRNKKIRFGPAKLPDCVVVLDTEGKSSVIMEAAKLQVPIVGLVDSSMPGEIYSKITYPIPGNDSVQFVYLLCNMITKTFLAEQKKSGLLKKDRENIDGKKGNGEKVGQIENSEKKSEIDSLRDEVLVVPYDSLAPISEDTVEAKMFLDKLVVVKFNGVLGTNMGFGGPKSAIEVHDKLTFMDLMVNQIESLNSKFGCNVPLVLMDTTETNNDTQKVVEKYSASKIDIHSFSQKPLEGQTGKDKQHPSDHGAVFLSLMKSGTLDVLLSQGKEYALVVHADNAAAVVDPKILNHLIQNKIEYCMEVTPTTSIDLRNSMINLRQGKYQLVNITQNPAKHHCFLLNTPADVLFCCSFMIKKSDGKFKFIDTRNLWVDLKAVKRLVDTDALKMESLSASKEENGYKINLQDTAAGSAIRFFDHTMSINVPPSRFLPLNSTSDLLLLQSDLYSSIDGILVRNNARNNPSNPSIELGPEFEKVSDFLSRFKSIPSIIKLDSLKVAGDVWFGAGITLKGRVNIAAKPGMKLEIPDGAVLENKEINDVADI